MVARDFRGSNLRPIGKKEILKHAIKLLAIIQTEIVRSGIKVNVRTQVVRWFAVEVRKSAAPIPKSGGKM